MKNAAQEFADFVGGFKFSPLQIPVVANVTGRIYQEGQIATLLSEQIVEGSVRWTDTIRFLMGKGITTYTEIGGERFLLKW